MTAVITDAAVTGEAINAGPGVVAGFVSSHAPQIWLRPRAEDPAEIDRVHDGYRYVARRLAEEKVDAVVVVGLDHLHSHFLDLIPQMTLVLNDESTAEFNGEQLTIRTSEELGKGLLAGLMERGYDPAFSFRETLDHSFFVPLRVASEAGLPCPVIPLVMNCYVPPQPSPLRCFDLGAAINAWAVEADLRVAVWGTGGMSHYPGTGRFHSPDLVADEEVLEIIRSGQFSKLAEMTAGDLDVRGMVELRTWLIALGSRRDKAAVRYSTYWDSGHCGYAVLEF